MSLLPNRFPIPQIPGQPELQDLLRMLTDFIQAVCDTFKHLNNDNIEDGLNLVTDAQLDGISLGSIWVIDGSSNLLRAGMPVYFSATKTVNLADADDESKRARAFCITTDGSSALLQFIGLINTVPIESGITISTGERLWLSSTAGHVTNVIPSTGLEQSVGVAFDNGTEAGGTVTVAARIDTKGIQPF